MAKNGSARILIPARLDAKRLPGKPLMDIKGIPMVIRVAQKCAEAVGGDLVIVTTPDHEIMKVCEKYGVNSIISSPQCASGTDRLVEFAEKFSDEILINVQGDEPMIPASVVKDFYDYVIRSKKTCIGISRIFDDSILNSDSVVKVATANSRLIYASRHAIGMKFENETSIHFKHTGIYGFTAKDLSLFGSSKRGPLETFENVEILRLIEEMLQKFDVFSLEARLKSEIDEATYKLVDYFVPERLFLLSNCDNNQLKSIVANFGLHRIFRGGQIGTPPDKSKRIREIMIQFEQEVLWSVSDSESDAIIARSNGINFIFIRRFARDNAEWLGENELRFENIASFIEKLDL